MYYFRQEKIRKSVILIGCCLLMTAEGMTYNCLGVYYEPISASLCTGIASISAFSTIIGAFMAISFPIAGKRLKINHINKTIAIGYFFWISAIASISLCNKLRCLYFIGIIMGISGAFCLTLPIPIIINNTYSDHAGKALGTSMAFAGIAGAVFNPIYAKLIDSFGWRRTSIFEAVMTAAIVFPVCIFVITDSNISPLLKEVPQEMRRKDITLKEENNWFPVLLISFCGMNLLQGYIQHLTNYGISKHMNESAASILVTAAMIGNMIGKITLGSVFDKYGGRKLLVVGMLLIFCGITCFSFMMECNLLLMLISSFLVGISSSMANIGTSLITMELYGKERYTSVYSSLLTGSCLVGCFGPLFVGTLYDKYHDYRIAFRYGMLLSIITVLSGLVIYCKDTLRKEKTH